MKKLNGKANALRMLSVDTIEKAGSGHPGMPLGMADIAEVLWSDYLKHSPVNPSWHNRDRFVLSNGHGSMLLYSLLHLSGYDLTIEDIKKYRQIHSKTPGHPEYGVTPGVEMTTGPLGQGLASSVGMALAEKILAAKFNVDKFNMIDHFTYVFAGDGCLMEGVSHEACSLAGTLGLGKLIVFYDDNNISIDGDTDGWFSEDTALRFKSYHWQVIDNVDGHDRASISKAIKLAQLESNKPTLIVCKTTIGKGAPTKSGNEKIHGAALGADEISAMRKALNWPHEPFDIPNNIYSAWDQKEKGGKVESEWDSLFSKYELEHPLLACELRRRLSEELPRELCSAMDAFMDQLSVDRPNVATRKASKNVLDVISEMLPELTGGSADLSESNCTFSDYSRSITSKQFDGNYIHYGVREFAMGAIMNGMALHKGFILFGGTFLVFSDYMRSAIRSAALMSLPTIYVFTHDSICLGSDGPTHQPIEHLASLRAMPNVDVWRPCDSDETAVAWKKSIEKSNGPTVLALSRQNLPFIAKTREQKENIAKGGYTIWESKKIEVILIATGSEVALCMEAADKLLRHYDIGSRVVSMPSLDEFKKQDDRYKNSVIPEKMEARVIVEAGSTVSWHQIAGRNGEIVGVDQYGESGSIEQLTAYFNFTVSHVISTAMKSVRKSVSVEKAKRVNLFKEIV